MELPSPSTLRRLALPAPAEVLSLEPDWELVLVLCVEPSDSTTEAMVAQPAIPTANKPRQARTTSVMMSASTPFDPLGCFSGLGIAVYW